MEKGNNIRVELFRVNGDYAPIIKVDYMDKDAKEHSGLFILDSGSNDNILSGKLAGCIGDHCKIEGKTGSIYTMGGEYMKVEYVKFLFTFGGRQFHEEFGINDVLLPKIAGDIPIIGILGLTFMQKHQLVIDYSDFTFHTSVVNPENLSISDCDFFTPMTIGLKYYGMPLLYMFQNEKEILTLADTGATNNVIASKTVTDNGFECKYMEATDTITGLAGSVVTEDAMMDFNLLTLKGEDIKEITYHDLFKISPHYIYSPKEDDCDEEGEPLPPIEAIVCSPFMAKEGWVLDFGNCIIYKRKAPESLREAV